MDQRVISARELELREALRNARTALRLASGKFRAARIYWEERIDELEEELARLREEAA
jgi:hypothetical protein